MPDVCLFCNQTVYFKLDTEARSKGHIYSEAGKREFRISGVCEACFDEVTAESNYD